MTLDEATEEQLELLTQSAIKLLSAVKEFSLVSGPGGPRRSFLVGGPEGLALHVEACPLIDHHDPDNWTAARTTWACPAPDWTVAAQDLEVLLVHREISELIGQLCDPPRVPDDSGWTRGWTRTLPSLGPDGKPLPPHREYGSPRPALAVWDSLATTDPAELRAQLCATLRADLLSAAQAALEQVSRPDAGRSGPGRPAEDQATRTTALRWHHEALLPRKLPLVGTSAATVLGVVGGLLIGLACMITGNPAHLAAGGLVGLLAAATELRWSRWSLRSDVRFNWAGRDWHLDLTPGLRDFEVHAPPGLAWQLRQALRFAQLRRRAESLRPELDRLELRAEPPVAVWFEPQKRRTFPKAAPPTSRGEQVLPAVSSASLRQTALSGQQLADHDLSGHDLDDQPGSLEIARKKGE